MDALGRVVIPRDIRQMMGVGEKDEIGFYTDDGHTVIIAPEPPKCIICGGVDDLINVPKLKVHICVDCMVYLTGNDDLKK